MGDRVAALEKIDYLSICLPVRKLLFHSIGVREGILPGGGRKICPENNKLL